MKNRTFLSAPYKKVKTNETVFANNLRIEEQHPYRIWRYVWDYEVDMPKLDVVPMVYKQIKGLSLFRYTQYDTLEDDINNNKLTFISPVLWKDPFEKQLYPIGNGLCDIACICFTYDWIESEEAAWNRSNNSGQTVRVEYDFDALCEELAKHPEYRFYFSVIDYSLPRTEIAALKNAKPSDITEYLNMMSLKRKAFLYENEIRLFLVRTPSNEPISNFLKLSVVNHKGLIKSICLPPDSTLTKESIPLKDITILQSRLYSIS